VVITSVPWGVFVVGTQFPVLRVGTIPNKGWLRGRHSHALILSPDSAGVKRKLDHLAIACGDGLLVSAIIGDEFEFIMGLTTKQEALSGVIFHCMNHSFKSDIRNLTCL
jgi:hypothetical protein